MSSRLAGADPQQPPASDRFAAPHPGGQSYTEFAFDEMQFDTKGRSRVNVTAEVTATIGELTQTIRINASREFMLKLNEGVLSSSPGAKIVISGIFRLYDERGDSIDVSD